MIVGGIEEIRIDDAANEIYVADNYLGGRVMVFDLDHVRVQARLGRVRPQAVRDQHEATRTTPTSRAVRWRRSSLGHLTFNFSNDGLVYAADRNGNRIHVTDKQGNFKQEFKLAEYTGVGGSTGGVAFSPDKAQKHLYISDLTNNHIWFLEPRGRQGRRPAGQHG